MHAKDIIMLGDAAQALEKKKIWRGGLSHEKKISKTDEPLYLHEGAEA